MLKRGGVVTTLDDLRAAVDDFLPYDQFHFDVETLPQDPDFSDFRGDWRRNRVVWLSMSTYGRTFVLPLGHPNGAFLRKEYPLTPTGEKVEEKRRAKGKTTPLESSYSKSDKLATYVFAEPPKHLRWCDDVRAILEPLFFSDRLKIAHNSKFDIKSIAKHFEDRLPSGPFVCTRMAGHLLDVRNTGFLRLNQCVEREIGYHMEKGVGKAIEKHAFDEVAKYSFLDSRYNWVLWKEYEERLQDMPGLFALERDVLEVVVRMEYTGAPVNVDRLKELDGYLRDRIQEETARAYRVLGRPLNIGSRHELQDALFLPKADGGRGLKPIVLTDGGKKRKAAGEEVTIRDYSTSEEAVAKYAGKDEFVDAIIAYGDLTKIHGGFVAPYLGGDVVVAGKTKYRAPLLVNGRLNAEFAQDGTETGRFSSKQPNLQQVPSRSEDGKKIRSVFSVEAIQGLVIVQADYSQIEPRIVADLSEDPRLLSVYLDGGDIYTTLAEPFGLERAAGKVLFLSIAYGTGPETLATAVKISLKDAKEIIYTDFPKAFPLIDQAKKHITREAKRRKPIHVRTLLGRRRYLPDLVSSDMGLRRRAERQAFNTYCQGSAADINKVGLVRTDRMVTPLGGEIFATVHDEVLVLAPEDRAEEIAAAVTEAMEGVELLKQVPLVAESKIVNTWAEAKD